MKNIILLILTLSYGLSFGQDFIVKNTNDTIKCKIISVFDDEKIYYDNGKTKTDISFSAVKSYSWRDTIRYNPANIPIRLNNVKMVSFGDTIEAPGKTKEQLYLLAKEWFVETFKSAKDVLQMDDKEAGILIGKGFSDIYMSMGSKVQMWYTIKLHVKDGKYRYEITEIYYKTYASYSGSTYLPSRQYSAETTITDEYLYKKNGKPYKVNMTYKEQTVAKASLLSKSIKARMEQGASLPNNDW